MTSGGQSTSARQSRRYAEVAPSQHRAASEGVQELPPIHEVQEFRVDLERIRFSPYFTRLSSVTQVVPQSDVGPVMHNRLTHSLKVSSVARVIAANLAGRQAKHRAFARQEAASDDPVGAVVERLGGCDTIVAQAASHAHDMGHPPFGHLGERALDRVARDRLGLPEGFEGNAQTLRILTRLDTLGRDFQGLNLTAAVRASVLKYPWTRAGWRNGLSDAELQHGLPRGVGDDIADGAAKFSSYVLEAEEMESLRDAFPKIAPGMQTLECAVMDLADDIAYAIHDLDEFTRAGVLQQAAVTGELDAWLDSQSDFTGAAEAALEPRWRDHGVSLELLWRRLERKDTWIADRSVFTEVVESIRRDLGEELLASPYDGGIDSERRVSQFTRRWIEHLRTAVVVDEHPHIRSGHVRLEQRAWHEVAVLKYVHARFVLENQELAQSQRGMARVIEGLALAFDAWLTDPFDSRRAPRRLVEWVDETTEELIALQGRRPDLVDAALPAAALQRQGRARAVLDYVASLTDQQAMATFKALHEGASGAGFRTL